MITIAFAVEIARPVDEVFAYLTDPDRLPEWQDNAVSADVEGGGPLRAGSRMREVRRAPFGREVTSLVEVSAYEPSTRFDLHIVEGPLPIDGDHTLSATATGTRIDFVAHGEPTGAMRLAQPLLRRLLDRQFRASYRTLKERLESRASRRS
jgi:uncharacterized protein YndB with AHSA1/START domain